MSKKEEFKEFVKTRPELASSVINNETTWQKLYETYDLYGEDNEIWNSFKKINNETKKDTTESNISIKNILNSLANIDVESFQSNISNIQKAIGFFEELTRNTKKNEKDKKVKKSQNYKTFDSFYSD